MSQAQPLDDLDDVARRLRTLSPRGRIDRDRVMYLAGQQAAVAGRPKRDRWAWPSAVFSTAIAAALAVFLTMRSDRASGPSVVNPKDAGAVRGLLADGYSTNDLSDAARPFSNSRLRQELLAGIWPGQSTTHSGLQQPDTVRPRDFDILSPDGLKL